jgi:hypothetical protein
MLRKSFFTVIILAVTGLSFAQIRATTESGNKVLLFENGSWQYEEKSTSTTNTEINAEVITIALIDVDSAKVLATDPKELFYLPSPRLVKYFGKNGGNIRCKLSCSNNLGIIKLHFNWEFPVIDGERYFGWFNEGCKVTFTMDDGQLVELLMGDESAVKRYDKSNHSMISNASLPLTKMQISALCAQPLRKMEVGWKKNPEEYEVKVLRFLMETLPTVL